jgi:hypothetical protein
MGGALVPDALSGRALSQKFQRNLEGLMNKKILPVILMVLAYAVGVTAQAKEFRY